MTGKDWKIGPLVERLRQVREDWRKARDRDPYIAGREFPSAQILEKVTESISAALYPLRLGPADLHPEHEDYFVGHTLSRALDDLGTQAKLELRYAAPGHNEAEADAKAEHIIREFAEELPRIRQLLDTDVEAAYRGDPAARSMDEIVLCYPGIRAMIAHRLAHALYVRGLPLLARMISEDAHSRTGIDIHPGAHIGHSFFIDHGTGVVIGETCIIGNRVRIYQAVTLGAKRFDADETGTLVKGNARHPIVEDDVVVYAGATILGRITIGRGSSIGGNVWLTHSVPADSQISQAQSRSDCE